MVGSGRIGQKMHMELVQSVSTDKSLVRQRERRKRRGTEWDH